MLIRFCCHVQSLGTDNLLWVNSISDFMVDFMAGPRIVYPWSYGLGLRSMHFGRASFEDQGSYVSRAFNRRHP